MTQIIRKKIQIHSFDLVDEKGTDFKEKTPTIGCPHSGQFSWALAWIKSRQDLKIWLSRICNYVCQGLAFLFHWRISIFLHAFACLCFSSVPNVYKSVVIFKMLFTLQVYFGLNWQQKWLLFWIFWVMEENDEFQFHDWPCAEIP